MNLRSLIAVTVLTSAALAAPLSSAAPMTALAKPYDSTHVLPGERYIVGPERDVTLLKTATTDTITAPVTVAHQVRDEYQNYGPIGVLSGAVRGGIKGSIQLIGAAVKGTIGIFDVATNPIGGIEN